MADKKIRPLVNSEPVSEFGEFSEDLGPEGQAPDILYVPGWSDLRHNRDLQMAEYAQGRRRGQDVDQLPVRVCWAAITRGAGNQPSPVKVMQHINDGYRTVKATEAGKVPWLTALPAGARVQPDGSIVNAAGDLTLMVIDARGAARNAKRIADAATAMQSEPAALRKASMGVVGADPTMDVTTGPPMTLPK